MLKYIVKRDGRVEDFAPGKLNHWSIWASENLGDRVDWSSVVMETYRSSGETVNSQDLQQSLINVCIHKGSWPYNLMAGRLYAALMHKKMYDGKMPRVEVLHKELEEIGLMRCLDYTDEEYDIINSFIDHKNDFNLAHFQIEQIIKKYSISDRQTLVRYETPQYTFMRLAMALAESTSDKKKRLKEVRDYYELFSACIINPPTPNYVNLGTKHNGYASCCLYAVDDNWKSLAVGDHIAYVMTCMSAGIGNFINVRSLGDKVRSGLISHQGKIPYYKALAGAVNANLQTGRGGACTAYYSAFDPEVQTITMLQNPRTPIDKKNRDIHFCIVMNTFFVKKVAKNEDIFTFNVKTAPDLMDAFFSEDQAKFEELYNKYESNPLFPKTYIKARQIALQALQQSFEVGTLYLAFIDEINRHTPHKDAIHSSNLCVAPETLLLTRDHGEVEIHTLKDQTVHVWNGEEWSETVVRQTGVNQPLLRVNLSQRVFLEVTPYHKWYVLDEDDNEVVKRTHELQHNDVISPYFLLNEFNVPVRQDRLSVCSVKDMGRSADTYCVTEPLRNRAVFNGVLTGQCLEITEPTKPYQSMEDLYSTEDHGRGEIALCSLAALVVNNIHSDELYEKAAYYSLKMIDRCIHISDYPLPHLGVTAKSRLNAGVGMVGLATLLARKGLNYTSREGKEEIHRISERHAYYLIKASLKLGQELGNAPWIGRTKWVEGWLPIDTYKKRLDEVVNSKLQYDWESLRKEIIANGGIRNSSLIAHMPTESSSKASGAPNGVYPVRNLALKKKDGSNVIDYCVVDSDLLKDKYQLAYTIPTRDLIECYAIIQKFTDQAISADLYKDRSVTQELSTDDMIKDLLHMVKYGVKTRYYQNSLTSDQGGNIVETEIQDTCTDGGCKI